LGTHGEMNRAYRVALICGAIPLLVGISMLMLWLITRWDGLMMAGIYSPYCGVTIFLVGVLALARFCWLAVRTPNIQRQIYKISAILTFLPVLRSTFPMRSQPTLRFEFEMQRIGLCRWRLSLPQSPW
jgi:hypothetical protein